MSTVASFIFTSLDGFYEGPNGEIDFLPIDDEFEAFAIDQLDAASALAFGRATYEHMAAYWPTPQAEANDPAITARMNGMDKLVFSTTLTGAGWSATTLVKDAITHIASLRASASEDVLLFPGSPHLTSRLAASGLLDELRILVAPVVLGQGRSLFEDLEERIPLSLLRVRQFRSGNVLHTYRPEPPLA